MRILNGKYCSSTIMGPIFNNSFNQKEKFKEKITYKKYRRIKSRD